MGFQPPADKWFNDSKEVAMAQQEISGKDRRCISECILKHWSENSRTPLQKRDDEYERCLTACRVCA